MGIFVIQVIMAGLVYFFLQKYVKSKQKSLPNTNGLYIAAILASASLLTYQEFDSYIGFFFTKAILFVSYFIIGYIIGFAWRKFLPIQEK